MGEKEANMLRKLLMVAMAAAVPMGAVALGAGTANAGAPLTAPPITCALSGTVNFAPPGISHNGAQTPNKTSSTTVTGETFNACTGGPNQSGGVGSPLTIVSKNTKCPKAPKTGPPPACVKPNYTYDTAASFAGTNLTTVEKAVKKAPPTIDGVLFKVKPTSAAQVLPGHQCGSSESGFLITGSAKSSPKYTYTSFSILACLGHDSGSGTTNNFTNDLIIALGGGSDVIATASIDPATSSIGIS